MTLKAALVGCGAMSSTWLAATAQIDGLQIVGLADLDIARTHAVAARHGLTDVVMATDVHSLLAQPDTLGKPAEVQARLAGSHLSVSLLGLPLRTPQGPLLLLRARPVEAAVNDMLPLETVLAKLAEGTRDGVVITDLRGHVLGANRTLLRWAQQGDEDQLRGQSLAASLGPAGPEVAALLAAVREQGLVQQGLCLQLPGAANNALKLDVTGMLMIDDEQERLGLILRPALQSLAAPQPLQRPTPQALRAAISATAVELARLKQELALDEAAI